MTTTSHRRTTMADVAKHAGVSVATVSKVVNNRYGVSAKTVELVQAVIAELGFHTSLGAQSMRAGRTGVLGILVSEFEPFSAEILKGASSFTVGSEYELLAYSGRSSAVNTGWEHRHLARLSGGVIDGAILVTPSVTDFLTDLPLVAVDPNINASNIPTVRSDNYGGARAAVDYLVSLGHQRIAFLGGRLDLDSAQQRELGYRDSLQSAGIEFDEELVERADFQPEAASVATDLLLQAENPPTAIFAANDLMALKALETAQEMGLQVPQDLSIIGFDNIPESAISSPSLTTVSQHLKEMGATAIEMLIGITTGVEVPHEVKLPTELVVRGSCAPPSVS